MDCGWQLELGAGLRPFSSTERRCGRRHRTTNAPLLSEKGDTQCDLFRLALHADFRIHVHKMSTKI